MKELIRKPEFANYFLAFSIIGLILVTIMNYELLSEKMFYWQKFLIILSFLTICLIGTVAALYPSKCSSAHFKNENEQDLFSYQVKNLKNSKILFHGHHPSCCKFSSHVLFFGKRKYCSGCLGLATGAITSLILASSYITIGYPDNFSKDLVIFLGFVFVTIGLLQYNISYNGAILHFIINIIFVLGAFLLLVTFVEQKGNLIVSLYTLALIIYWIFTRIILSQIEHKRICQECEKSCNLSYK